MDKFDIKENEYLTNKENFKQFKRQHTTILKNQKKKLSKIFKEHNKIKFRVLDILFVFFILFNIGALVITNMLVVKNNPDTTFMEANPATSELYGFVEHSDAKPIMLGFVVSGLAWTYIIGWYLYNRIKIHTTNEYYVFVGIFIYLGMSMTLDFFNDFGYWLGKILWG